MSLLLYSLNVWSPLPEVATPSIILIYSSRTASPIIIYSSRTASPVYISGHKHCEPNSIPVYTPAEQPRMFIYTPWEWRPWEWQTLGVVARAVKSCQKTHPGNRSRQHRLTVYT